jgi:hypothetical protein
MLPTLFLIDPAYIYANKYIRIEHCYVSATSCFTEGHTPPYLLLKLTDVLTDVITDVLTDV